MKQVEEIMNNQDLLKNNLLGAGKFDGNCKIIFQHCSAPCHTIC